MTAKASPTKKPTGQIDHGRQADDRIEARIAAGERQYADSFELEDDRLYEWKQS